MYVINIQNLTKDYGHGRGVFDITLQIEKGACYGFLGPNGAGKTTAIRHLMGFSKPQKGRAEILGKDCLSCSAELKNFIGYLPGEISFPMQMIGMEFLEYMGSLRKISIDYCYALTNRFGLSLHRKIRQMSLGDKRKLAVAAAFMHDPDILILDEPTSGLDPVMQEVFIDFIRSEKERGKTILLSSHIFHEVDAVCDRISIIKEGRIAADFSAEELKSQKMQIYRIAFETEADYNAFVKEDFFFTAKSPERKTVRLMADSEKVNVLIDLLSALKIRDLQEIPYTLEDHFMQFYEERSRKGETCHDRTCD